MTLYADSQYPVRADLDAVHAKQLDQLADPGTWGTGAQRLAVAGEIRRACYSAGIQEEPEGIGPQSDVELPETARTVIRKLAVTPNDYVEDTYEEATSGGLSRWVSRRVSRSAGTCGAGLCHPSRP